MNMCFNGVNSLSSIPNDIKRQTEENLFATVEINWKTFGRHALRWTCTVLGFECCGRMFAAEKCLLWVVAKCSWQILT